MSKNQLINLEPIEYQGQRIMTSQQLADFYEVDKDILRKNFNNNKNQYIEGIDYFIIPYEDPCFGKICLNASTKRPMYAWTESGALMHAKSVNSPVAWNVYRQLVDLYFRVKEAKQNLESMNTDDLIDFLRSTINRLDEVNQEKKMLSAKIDQDKPYTDYGRKVEQEYDTIPLSEWSDIIGWGPIKLFRELRNRKILRYDFRGDNVPYRKYIDAGRLVKTEKLNDKDKSPKKGTTYFQTWITGTGRVWLCELLNVEEKE